jgi:EmrB/QacA subfamily drug resistance transporter
VSAIETTGVPAPARWMRSYANSRWAALPVLMAGTFMIVTDFFIVNVAFPSIQADLHASGSAIEWVVAGYGLTYASFQITAGRIGDHIGRRRLLAIGLLLFVLSSVACGVAPGPASLVAARLVQGLAAAMISPSALSILGVIYTGQDRVQAISIYGMTLGLAAAGGQLMGGILIHWDVGGLGWRLIFLINVPVGIAALSLIRRLVPESRAEHARRLDPAGMTLVTLAAVALVLPLVEGPQVGWPTWTWLCLGLAVPLAIVFLLHQSWLGRRGGDPLIELGLFRRRSLAVGLATQLGLWCSMASFFLVLALYLQHGRGLDALQAGSVFTILAAAFVATSLRAPALTLRYGRWLIATGALTLAAGFGALLAAVSEIGAAGSLWTLVPGLLLVGAGQGLTITPLTATVLSHAERERAGTVSGVLSTMQQMGNALGVAITGVIFFTELRNGFAHAFATSLIELSCLLLGVAALTWLLPGNQAAPK